MLTTANQMMKTVNLLLLAIVCGVNLQARSAETVLPPAPYGPLPSARQLAWHELEFYGFIQFTINTYNDKKWGYGDESHA